MGNLKTCCLRDKIKKPGDTSTAENEEELQILLSKCPQEIVINSIPFALLLLEKNTTHFDTTLKFEFDDTIEPYNLSQLLQNLQFAHDYKKFSIQFGPFLTNSLAETLFSSLQCMNALESLELLLGENPELNDKFMESLGLLVKNSICFGLKSFRLELRQAGFSKVEGLMKPLLARDSIEDIALILTNDNLNDEDYDLIFQLFEKENLKVFELEARKNHGHEPTARKLVEMVSKNKGIVKAVLNLSDNNFQPKDIKKMKEAMDKKNGSFVYHF